ncbi:MAG: hypothetical protein ACTSWN_02200 [Promethearchaeota archaeon]
MRFNAGLCPGIIKVLKMPSILFGPGGQITSATIEANGYQESMHCMPLLLND